MRRRNIDKYLTEWSPEDGEYIDLAFLMQALPPNRWDLYLIGESAGKQKKIPPLLGRRRSNRNVVIVESLRNWMITYFRYRPAVVDAVLADLIKGNEKYQRQLKDMRIEVAYKSGTKRGAKPKKVEKSLVSTSKLKVTSNELFTAWK